MNVKTLKLFCDVVRARSFSRGAELNGVSQSAATQAVDRLENELGVKLIDRAQRPLELTAEGKLGFEGYSKVVELCDLTATRVRESFQRESGIARVAAIYSVGLHEVSRSMREFMKRNPDATIRLELLHYAKVYQAVAEGGADVGLVSYPSETSEIGVIPLRSEEMVVVVPPNDPLAKEKRIEWSRLRDVDLVAFDRDLPIGREVDKRLRQNGVRVRVTTELDNIETLKQAIEVGLGVGILPEPTVTDDVNAGKLVSIPLDPPDFTRPLGAIYKRRKTFTPTLARFLELLGAAFDPEKFAQTTASDSNESETR